VSNERSVRGFEGSLKRMSGPFHTGQKKGPYSSDEGGECTETRVKESKQQKREAKLRDLLVEGNDQVDRERQSVAHTGRDGIGDIS